MRAHTLDDLTEINPVPGFHAKIVHGDGVTLAFWRVESGATLPVHEHPHEQVLTVLEGRFELTVDGVTRTLGVGEVVAIPGGVPHGGTALEDCRLQDVFQPKRDDL